ncbi:hypothetical protein [Roseovarius sp.]|uniref:hypothetical protein n=1 Tax=Roseovarius sp. TaxID=1486281 RepID=UPI00257C3B8A|nr:hypothetical protein [Roseovarius sp.]
MLQDQFGIARDPNPLQMTFLRWQCRVRQMAMRDQEGRPDDAITPAVYLPGEDDAMGHIITLLNKSPGYSVTAELDYMAAKTNDPAQRRDQALQFLAAGYYQNAVEFSDILTATFPPGSEGAKTLHEAGHVTLVFEAFNQRFDLKCKVWRLAAHNPLHAATIAHNRLFNPALPPGTEVLGFEPDWDASSAAAPGR